MDLITDHLKRLAAERGLDAGLLADLVEEARRRAIRAPADGPLVGFQGGPFAWSAIAARRFFEPRGGARLAGSPAFANVVAGVSEGRLAFGVLPAENSIAGTIHESYDLLLGANVRIVGEIIQRIDHVLCGIAGADERALARVLSHPQALAQCGRFLASHPAARAEAFVDTALAAAEVARLGDPHVAAICSEEAALAHGLVVLRRGIADAAENFTRFHVIGPGDAPAVPDADKTTLVMALRHERGALARVLTTLAEHGLNLTKLESRPRPERPFEYLFYVDVAADAAAPATARALDAARARCSFLRVLGSYASAGKDGASATPAGPAATPSGASAPTAPPKSAVAEPARAPSAWRLASRATKREDTVVRLGPVAIGGSEPFVIMAGPCSVETEEQIRATAAHVREHGARVLRGGVFKPRTSPYSFQGLGYAGLDLLAAAGRAHGMPVVTEVMAPEQVARVAALADMLQIGARNMQNFDLLKEVGRARKPVLLKRGLSASLDELLSAAEYVLAQGNQDVVLCERGIRTFETAMRSTLDLGAVVVLRERTHLPVVVDPSHAAGVRRWVAPLARAAKAIGAHGVLVEVHPNPPCALSDAEQALSFEDFAALVRGLP